MVAAHAWDLARAINVGLQTVFVARREKTHYPNLAKPDHVVSELSELVKLWSRKLKGHGAPGDALTDNKE